MLTDIDECSELAQARTCRLCENTIGGYRCHCEIGLEEGYFCGEFPHCANKHRNCSLRSYAEWQLFRHGLVTKSFQLVKLSVPVTTVEADNACKTVDVRGRIATVPEAIIERLLTRVLKRALQKHEVRHVIFATDYTGTCMSL